MATVTSARPASHAYTQSGIGALILGVVGALFGLGGFVAVVIGDDMIAMSAASIAMAILAIVALGSVALVRDHPVYAAIGMAIAPIGYVLACAGSWGMWWTKYQDAVATSAAAENAFWASMPAMALFAISGVLLVIAAALAAYSSARQDATYTEA